MEKSNVAWETETKIASPGKQKRTALEMKEKKNCFRNEYKKELL